MTLCKDVVREYLTFYRDLELKLKFGDNESVTITPYKFGYLVTYYKDDEPDSQYFFELMRDAENKFEELAEKYMSKCIIDRRDAEQKEVSKYEQTELPF